MATLASQLRAWKRDIDRELPALVVREIGIEARRVVPVRTGFLRSTIQVLALGVVQVTAFYAVWVEYGTRYFRGRFFLRRAFDRTLRRWPTL